MNTKSKIQLIKESIELKENFKESLNSLMDKYNIKDNIFVVNNGKVLEAVNGYFVVNKEYDSFNEALAEFNNPNDIVIRIENNNKFTTGSLYEYLSECPEDSKILDITTEKYVY